MTVTRIVIRVADAVFTDPYEVCEHRRCGRCRELVWLAVSQLMPVPPAFQELVCIQCALADPGLAGGVAEVYRQTRNAARWASS